MKLLWGLALLLLVASAVQSVPTNDEALNDNTEDDDQNDEEMHIEKMLQDMDTDTKTDIDSHQDASAEEEDDGDEAQLEEVKEDKTAIIAQNNKGAIRHGDTIALQTFVRNRYLSCAGHRCDGRTCPNMEITGSEWLRCWGEVFQIYRQNGPGYVRNGDKVGLYYPRESGRWFACPGSPCGKATCPGTPHSTYGFSSRAKWRSCWGEVFQIYTMNKPRGRIINSDDDVVLYYVRGRQWVSQGYGGNTLRTTCLGRSFPPRRSDTCAKETFTIWKKVC